MAIDYKKQMLNELLKSAIYKSAVSGLDDASKEHVERSVGEFLGNFADQLLTPLSKHAESPEFKEAFIKRMRHTPDVNVTGSVSKEG